MKKFSLLLLCVFLLLASTVYAHPGRTDANGGHYDRSTGEYHYHHGYPAHQHYDIDGDGTIDCPYDFKDNTDHTTRSSGSSSSQSRSMPADVEKSNVTTSVVSQKTTKKKSIWETIKTGFVYFFLGIFGLFGVGVILTIIYGIIYSLIIEPIKNRRSGKK